MLPCVLVYFVHIIADNKTSDFTVLKL